MDFWLLALSVAGVSAIAAGIEIIISILNMRAPGMSLSRMPLFAWAMLVTSFSILFAFTPLFVASMLMELDRHFGTQFFNTEAGGTPILMGAEQIAWVPELPDYNITDYKSTHITGGAIMGSSPENSVTNKYGQVWDTPNLFVTGAALFPQNPGANPSDTLCALSYMTSDALVQRYFRDPNRMLV